ncbi:ribonuclease H [Agrobacterium sp. NPDC090273]|uniref:ribonuclease H family protein n=1 Tax=Agrobacterium sp. NPDC090273 TaxID=3363919 RepID=UPI00383B01CC
MNNLESQPHILIYTDGSCHGNPGPGGFAATLRRITADGAELKYRRVVGFEPDHTTNIPMEMTAVASALGCLQAGEPLPVIVRPDLKLIYDAMTKWVPGWIANGWRKGDGKSVSNCDLWKQIITVAEGKTIIWDWVKGHAGGPRNEEVDHLAGKQTKLARSKAAEIMFAV